MIDRKCCIHGNEAVKRRHVSRNVMRTIAQIGATKLEIEHKGVRSAVVQARVRVLDGDTDIITTQAFGFLASGWLATRNSPAPRYRAVRESLRFLS